jgi:hypothetical protein
MGSRGLGRGRANTMRLRKSSSTPTAPMASGAHLLHQMRGGGWGEQRFLSRRLEEGSMHGPAACTRSRSSIRDKTHPEHTQHPPRLQLAVDQRLCRHRQAQRQGYGLQGCPHAQVCPALDIHHDRHLCSRQYREQYSSTAQPSTASRLGNRTPEQCAPCQQPQAQPQAQRAVGTHTAYACTRQSRGST